MFLADYHTHTKYSFDSKEEPETLCKKAIEKGLTAIAITDHYDCDYKEFEYPMVFDMVNRRKEIMKLKEKYAGRLDVIYGIELGQPHNCAEDAVKLLREGEFEFVIGSLHNLRKLPDFYYFDYTKVKGNVLRSMIKKMFNELCAVADFGGIDTLAHITYPHRYIKAAGLDIDFKEYYSEFDKLYNLLIKNDISLEINTSTLWKGYDFTMPTEELLKLYYECGGRLITVGSDAHAGDNVGGGISEAYEMLKRIGFKTVTTVKNGKRIQVEI